MNTTLGCCTDCPYTNTVVRKKYSTLTKQLCHIHPDFPIIINLLYLLIALP